MVLCAVMILGMVPTSFAEGGESNSSNAQGFLELKVAPLWKPARDVGELTAAEVKQAVDSDDWDTDSLSWFYNGSSIISSVHVSDATFTKTSALVDSTFGYLAEATYYNNYGGVVASKNVKLWVADSSVLLSFPGLAENATVGSIPNTMAVHRTKERALFLSFISISPLS